MSKSLREINMTRYVPLKEFVHDAEIKLTRLWTLAFENRIKLRYMFESNPMVQAYYPSEMTIEGFIHIGKEVKGAYRIYGTILDYENLQLLKRNQKVVLHEIQDTNVYRDGREEFCRCKLLKSREVVFDEILISIDDASILKGKGKNSSSSKIIPVSKGAAPKSKKSSASGNKRTDNNQLAALGAMMLLYLKTTEGRNCLENGFDDLISSFDIKEVDCSKVRRAIENLSKTFDITKEGFGESTFDPNLKSALGAFENRITEIKIKL